MIYLIYAIIFVVGALIHLFVSKQPRTPRRVVEVFLLWLFGVLVGLGGVVAFIAHAFYGPTTAASIGFPAHNPFQFEVAVSDLAFGVLGFLCLRWRGSFWWATILGWGIFLEGDAYGHIVQIIQFNNHHPDNAGGALYMDILAPLVGLGLLIAYDRLSRKEVPETTTSPAAISAASVH